MDIKEFIKETLIQISEGICEANKQMSSRNSFVATENITNQSGIPVNDTYSYKEGASHLVRPIDFDIAVTVSDASAQSGKGGIEVLSLFHAGGGIENQSSSNTTHKIKFSIPLALPVEPKK